MTDGDEDSRHPTAEGSAHRPRHHRRHHSHSRMAPCPACGRMIGRRWSRCPFCGEVAPFSVSSHTGIVIVAAIAIPLLLFIVGYLIAVLFT